MARNYQKKDKGSNFNAELKKLRSEEPGRLYLLYGQEEYLRDFYLNELKARCLPDGDDGFSYKRMDGPALAVKDLMQAMDVMPFLSERTFLELRNMDVNRPSDADSLMEALSGIPDYCTVCFVLETGYELDGRLKFVKFLKEKGRAVHFAGQDQTALLNWIERRFAAQNKSIGRDASQRLVAISGGLMKMLIPEIEKIAAYAKGDRILVSDVEAAAHHIPEADIFDMTNAIAAKQFDQALHILSELLKEKSNEPIMMLSLLSSSLRRTYGVRLMLNEGKRRSDIMSYFHITWDFIADQMISSAGKFTAEQLEEAIAACVETEYSMKSSSGNDADLLRDLIMHIIIENSYE